MAETHPPTLQIERSEAWEEQRIRRYAWVLGVIWTLSVAGSLLWNMQADRRHVIELARASAAAYLDKDEAFRLWGADHGGVYVPISEKSPPNPHLEHLDYRDIDGPDGRKLTLINPAYMLRLLYDDYTQLFGIKGRITSLKPLREENAPDAWERQTLEAFAQGKEEIYEVTQIEDQPYLRLMRRFLVREACLKCHRSQGYKVGDVRGGISVSAPLTSLTTATEQKAEALMLWHGLLWLSGVLVLAWMVSRIQGLLKEKYDVVSELSKQHQTLTAILSHAPLGIRLQDPSGRLQFVNKAFCEAFGMSEQQLLALDNYAQQYPPQAARVSLAADAEALVQEKPHYSAEQILLADGYEHEFDMIRVRHVDSSGRTSGLITLGLDVTEKKAAQARISHLAYYDSLTGLPNRLQVLERLQQDIARARRHGHSGALLMIDLDQFKTINDSLGHPLGDALLRRIAARLDDDKRAEDFVGRLGGDEFVVLLPEIADSLEFTARSASQKANFLRDYLSKPCTVKGHELHITVSIGVALFPAGQEQANDVLQQADTALFRAKEAGRNAVRFFAPAMQQAANERLSMQTALRRALDNAEFDLAFQPQVGSEGKLKGAEVLLRWTRGEGGPVSPAVFIPIAEETGIVHRLGEFVLRGACERLSIWRKHPLLRVLSISVNVSPRQFRQADFVPRLEALLAEFSVDPRRLMLELTEGVVISDVEDTCSKMAALKRIGVCLSIDDFGTGYSSLSYLKRLPLDELKIDQSFVRDIISDANDAAIVETIVAMAGHLGLEVIAEGVESAEVLACLRQKGCRAFQGYYFGRPGPVEDTENLLLRDLSG